VAQADNVAAELIELEGSNAAMPGEVSKMDFPLGAATQSTGNAAEQRTSADRTLLASCALEASRRRIIGDVARCGWGTLVYLIGCPHARVRAERIRRAREGRADSAAPDFFLAMIRSRQVGATA
jgi:hypothetical protein